ncbi:MAG: tryptophan 7-halogenase [Myxococcales bacterium]|nr:tryptophan 7-halogenase [Myxococcales bacterium]
MPAHAAAERWDVIVVGAGPAGSACAALLAARGFRVLVLDRDEFPRFRIGESLLPASNVVLEALGLEPPAPEGGGAVDETFFFKGGGDFIREASGHAASFSFADALPGPPRGTWHVDRSRFDRALRDLARERGAEVRHGERDGKVCEVDIDPEAGVTVTLGSGARERGRYLVDASGQGRLMARRLGSVQPYEHFGKAAAFTHYAGVSDAAFAELLPQSHIRIMIIEDGWGWVIPLPGARLSVGVVSRGRGIRKEDVFDYVASSALVSRLTAGAEASAPRLVSNFSYRNASPHGARYCCIGDSACFIDPVFSSGVSLALVGAREVCEQLGDALEHGREGEPDLMQAHGEKMQRAYDVFAALVNRFYNTRFIDQVLFRAPDAGTLRRSVISVFTGDVFRPDNTFAAMLVSSRTQPPSHDQQAHSDHRL